MDKLTVLFITHYSEMYGANNSLFQLIMELKIKYKIVPIVILPKKGEFSEKLKEKNIKYIISTFYLWVHDKNKKSKVKQNIKLFLNKIYILKILKKIRYEKIDIIHTNSSVINIGAEISKRLKITHIWHIREFGEEDYNLIYDCGYVKSCKYIEKNSDKIIAISKSIKSKYSKFISENKIEVIYNGISRKYIIKKTKNNIKGKVEIVLIGLLHEKKNQLEALEAVKILKEEYKKSNFKLNIIGSGCKNYTEKMQEYIKNNNLQDYIKFWGYREDISIILKNMDLGLITSKKEAFGRVTVEMMLAHLPIIGANTGGTKEIINKDVGFLYESGNSLELSKYINVFLENQSLINLKGIKAFERAEKYFLSEINSKKIYSIYESIKKGR